MKRTKPPKCKCGCGEFVTKRKNSLHWNTYLPGHNLKLPLTEEQEKRRRSKIGKALKKYLSENKEAIEKRRISAKGRKHSKKSKEKISEAAKIREKNKKEIGWHHSEETKKKISEKGKGRSVSQSTKQKLAKKAKGRKISDMQKKQISSTLKTYFQSNINPFKGRHHSEETKAKLRKANLGRFRGKNGPNWKGGISSHPYGIEWTKWLRQEIKQLDNNKCRICGENNKSLDVHHIDFNKNNNNKTNLITLCKKHHGKANREVIDKETLQSLLAER
jgi:hypothetical protein